MVNLEEKVKKLILLNAKGVDENYEITAETHLINDLNMGSIELIQLIVSFEEELDIEFDAEEMDVDRIMTFGSLMQVLKESMADESK